MTIVLGVDGGGTKTHAVVADTTGEVLGVALNGPSNWETVGVEGAGRAVEGAVDRALSAAGLERADLGASVFGLAGVDWDSDVPRLAAVIHPLGIPGPRAIVNDSFVALRAGTHWPWGVVVIAGTGTVAAGRNPAGEVFRTLGQSQIFGDFGSATDVSMEAIKAVAMAYTGRGPKTALTEMLCAHAGCGSAVELLETISRQQIHGHGGTGDQDVENVAPIVLRTAEGGDAVAREIVERAGASLGEAAALVATRLSMEDQDFETVLAGGLFRDASRFLMEPLEVALKRVVPRAVLVYLDAPPVVGAVLMAMELATPETFGGVHQRLSAGVIRALRVVPP